MIRSASSRLGGWLCAFALLAAAPAAADPLREETSLRFVPADAAFYNSMLRNREQFDSVVNSRAYATFLEIPTVQMGIQGLKMLIDPASAFEGMDMEEFDAEGFGDEPGGEGLPGEEGEGADDDSSQEGDQFRQPADDENLDPDDEPSFGEGEAAGDEFAPGDLDLQGPGAFGPLGGMQQWMADPQNQELLALMGDAVSHEIFFYGGDGYLSLFELIAFANTLQAQVQTAPDVDDGAEDGSDPQAQQQRLMLEKTLEFLDQRPELLAVPELIVGFKLSDAAPAEKQLARLEAELQTALAAEPQLAGRLTRETVAGSEYLTLKLDGGLIPWDEIIAEEAPEDQPLVRRMAEKVKPLTVVISFGVREEYLLLSIGPTSAQLATLGNGPLLVDRPELAPVAAEPERRFTGIGYVSEEFMARARETQWSIERLSRNFEAVIPLLDDLTPELREQMQADVRAFAADMQPYFPKAGAATSFTFLNGRGTEGYDYNWGDEPGYDASQPLSILEHVGGNPLFFSAARHSTTVADYDLAVKWIKRMIYYGQEMGLAASPPEQRQAIEMVMDQFAPLLKRTDEITRTLLAPALDGQTAFVIDADLTSKAWNQAMPSGKPMPMLEFGFVLGLRDPDKLKEAAGGYFDVAQQALIMASGFGPPGAQPPALPLPKSRDFDGHSIYYYVLPKELGFDKRIAPNAGVSDSMAAVSLLPLFTQRLLEPATLSADGPVGNHYSQPLAAATKLDFASTIDALRPWIDLGIDSVVESMSASPPPPAAFAPEDDVEDVEGVENGDEGDEPDEDAGDRFGEEEEEEGLPDDAADNEFPGEEGFDEGFGEAPGGMPPLMGMMPSAEEIKAQVSTFLDIISCFRSYSSVTYQEDGAWVTHRETRYEDLPEE